MGGGTRRISGWLIFTPANNSVGVQVLNVTLADDGGIDRGGINSFVRQLTITVVAVNDPPTFAVPALISVLESSGITMLIGFASAIQGAAIFRGAGLFCKKDTKAQELQDWDKPPYTGQGFDPLAPITPDGPPTGSGESLTAATFIMNNGELEAMQFDGKLNLGLLVAENVNEVGAVLSFLALLVQKCKY